jgi:putative membrane protein
MKRFLTAACVVAGAMLWTGAQARPDVVEKVPKEGTKALNANDFLIKAVECGHAEVEFSKLAQKNASDAKVKDFANKLVQDHTAANKKLLQQARGLKVGVVAGLDKDKRNAYRDLSKRSGADFDREYMRIMVEDHEKAVRLFGPFAKTGAHEGLRTFANDTLPKLQAHLKDARAIYARLKGGSSPKAPSRR